MATVGGLNRKPAVGARVQVSITSVKKSYDSGRKVIDVPSIRFSGDRVNQIRRYFRDGEPVRKVVHRGDWKLDRPSKKRLTSQVKSMHRCGCNGGQDWGQNQPDRDSDDQPDNGKKTNVGL